MLQDQNTNDITIQKPTDSEAQAQDAPTNPSNVEADVATAQTEEARPEQDAQVDPSASSDNSGSTPEDPEALISDLRSQLDTANAELRVVQGRLAVFTALTAADKATDQADSTDATVPIDETASDQALDQTEPDSTTGDETDSSLSTLPESDSSDNSEKQAEDASAEPSPEMAATGEASALPVEGEV